MRTVFAFAAVLITLATPALADRPVTEAERAKLVAAITAAGCSGGKMEWDEREKEFEVDDAVEFHRNLTHLAQ
ncbi:hypothetical protein D9M73_73970 [compost metagenome]